MYIRIGIRLHQSDIAVLQTNLLRAENMLFWAFFKHLRVTVTSFPCFIAI